MTSQSNSTNASNEPDSFEPWEGSSSFIRQGKHWSASFIWLSSAFFFISLVFAFTARLDQTVSVRGQLEPIGSTPEVKSTSNGVVSDVFVKEGESVVAGQTLLAIESEGLRSKLSSIQNRLLLLNAEREAISSIISSGSSSDIFLNIEALAGSDADLLQQISTARKQSDQVESQLRQLAVRLDSRTQSLELKERIAQDMKPLFLSGGLARNTYLEQLNTIQILKAELSSLKDERSRIIGFATSRLNSLNREKLALTAELDVLTEAVKYLDVKSPVSGTVFNLKVAPLSVVSSSQILLKIVPSSNLQAKVAISNNDIGFVNVGLPVSVSVDSFPSGEFGYIKGELISLGSDSLPPDIDSSQTYFPATVSLTQQKVLSGDNELNLQSGMGVTANIKLRSRPVISLLTDMFTKQLDGVKRFR